MNKWIWCNSTPSPDEYGDFVDEFIYEKGKAILRISADCHYAAYINGTLAAWGQYADYPWDKIYDEVDVTDCCNVGRNRLAVLVWYGGFEGSFTWYPGNAGLLFELECEGVILCESSESTLSRLSKAYVHHRGKLITPQIGFAYTYDATKEDDWKTGELVDFEPSVLVNQTLPLRIRPCKKLELLPEVLGGEHKRINDTDVVFKLDSYQGGFLSFELESPCEQDITISYGEHLVDGCVRRIIGRRDFSVTYHAKKGKNSYINYFRRFACQFLEVCSEQPLVIHKMAIAPTVYPLKEQARPNLSPTQNQIYDMCEETLKQCMHEHYEDCPWREQSLYCMDSRNQMLCGYYAFQEYEFPRASLELMSKDRREDGILAICFPTKVNLVIPSFSLHYFTQCREYLEYSGDKEFLRQIYPKLDSIMKAFTERITDGLIPRFSGEGYWNFYEWMDYLTGSLGQSDAVCEPDVVLNALLSYALQNLSVIADELAIEHNYRELAEMLNCNIRETFWDEQKQICYHLAEHDKYSQLGSALAILCGAIQGEEAKVLCERMLTDTEMTPITLSMSCFKYDAWLKIDKEKYTPIILENIEEVYAPMLAFGGNTVWETQDGESAFGNAGSLCHGWSAMPIYYYHTLLSE